jgi:hypothetical protein
LKKSSTNPVEQQAIRSPTMLHFRVRAGKTVLPVEFGLAGQNDLKRLGHWRAAKRVSDNPHIRDTLEFCRLAGKRWKTYRAANRTVTTFDELRRARGSRNEVVFVMLARAAWHKPSPILGFCFCRRTWCHHVVLDFAAAHPNAIAPAGGAVHGVGSGMLYSLVHLANGMGVKTVWGEATENSATFYEKTLEIQNVTDHFFINGDTFQHCLREFEVIGNDNRP